MRGKLSVLAVLILAVAISAYSVGGTYAKYTTTANVTGTATVAKWAVAMKANDTTIEDGDTFDLSATILDTDNDAAETDVVTGLIAPGTYGEFSVEIDSTGTQVSYGYTVKFTVENAPTNIKFYSDNTYATEITADGDGKYTAVSDTVTVADAATAVNTVPIYWKWVYETADDQSSVTAGDIADTTNGIAGASMNVNLTLTATQVD